MARKVVIASACRTAIGTMGGSLSTTPAADLGAIVIKEAVKRAGAGGHKEINRTNLSLEQIEAAMGKEVVQKQLELLRLRNTNPAFGFDSNLDIKTNGSVMTFTWTNGEHSISLDADFADYSYSIK